MIYLFFHLFQMCYSRFLENFLHPRLMNLFLFICHLIIFFYLFHFPVFFLQNRCGLLWRWDSSQLHTWAFPSHVSAILPVHGIGSRRLLKSAFGVTHKMAVCCGATVPCSGVTSMMCAGQARSNFRVRVVQLESWRRLVQASQSVRNNITILYELLINVPVGFFFNLAQ